MNRKQVSLDLGTPALSPTVQRAGQYNVAVQATPKTNSALQLAQALRVAPQVLGQASNIAQGLGAEAAAKVENVEEALQDKEVKGILGYNKAYQHMLVKRHFSTNEESIRKRFMNIADSPEYLAMNEVEFVNAMQNERKEFIEELMGDFGGNANREQAIAVLSNTFVDGLIDDAQSKWTENQRGAVVMEASAEAQKMMTDPEKGVAAAMNHLRKELGSVGIGFKTVGNEMRGVLNAAVSLSTEKGQFDRAEEMVAEAEKYLVTGKATLLGTTEGKLLHKTLLSNIERGRSRAERVQEESGIQFEDLAVLALSGLNQLSTPENVSASKKRAIKDAILYLDPEADVEALYADIFNGIGKPQENFGEILAELGVNGSDTAREAYISSAVEIGRKLTFINNSPMNAVSLPPDYKEKALIEYEKWYNSQTDEVNHLDWIAETGQPFRAFDELIERNASLSAGNYVRQMDQFKGIDDAIESVARSLENDDFAFNETVLINLQTEFEQQLIDYGREVAESEDPKGDVINKYKELYTDVTERLQGLATAASVSNEPISEDRAAVIEDTPTTAASRGRESVHYKTLNLENPSSALRQRRAKGRNERVNDFWQEVSKERKEMLERRHFGQLELSLYRHGFPSYSPENTQLLLETGLDSADVKLVANLRELAELAEKFQAVIIADTGLNTLTEEQKEIRKQYQDLGIETLEDSDQFVRLQHAILESSR